MVDVWSGGTRQGVTLRSFWESSAENTAIRLAGVYEKGVSKRYYDTGPVVAAIDAATTIADLEVAIAPVMDHAVATLNIQEVDVTRDGYTLAAVTMNDARLKPFLRYMVESLSQIKAGKATGDDLFTVHVGKTLVYNGTQVSGVAFNTDLSTYLSVNQTAAQFETVGSADNVAHPHLFMHELGHLIEAGSKDDYSAAWNSMYYGFRDSNPPGFSYGSTTAATSFTGEHPEGFTRGYARTSQPEDLADMIAYMTVPALYPTLVRWMQADPYLVKKQAVVKKYLSAIGWGAHAIEEMHGHVAQVRPL